MTSTATSRSSTTSVQRERSAPWTTRGRVETNISPHGLLFFNGLWQRYISSRCVVFPTSFLQRQAEQRRVFAPPCVHPRAGRQCIALTKRKACRASLLWAKRRRGDAVWSSLTSTKAGEFKTKLKINHWRSSPGPPELAGFYVDSVWPQHCQSKRHHCCQTIVVKEIAVRNLACKYAHYYSS